MPVLEIPVPTTIVIRADEVVAMLSHAVAEKGPNHMAWGVYAMNGAPVCIVGYALAWLGVPIEALQELDFRDARIGSVTAINILRRFNVEMQPAAGVRLSMAQSMQDRHHAWGAVVTEMERLIRYRYL